MKITTKAVLAFFPLSAALIWTVAAQTVPTQDDTGSTAQEQAEARMDERAVEIQERVGMSAVLELPGPGESDFVADAVRDGLIIEATLEEVEAALEAAKATPENDDDVAAARLAHWGSYRFFLDAAEPAQGE